MTKIVQKRLPNAISVADVTDVTVRQKLMLANQNIATLAAQLAEAQQAIAELQRRGGTTATAATSTAEMKMVIGATLQEHGIADNAEQNVQADWDESDSEADSFVRNKPAIPNAQANSDWSATNGVAQILNKPTALKNPNALTINDSVQYDGSEAVSITVLTKHQDISGKINYPTGGSNGNVLMKQDASAVWRAVSTGNSVTARTFTYTSGNMNSSTSAFNEINVKMTGWTPILVGNVACEGTSTAYYDVMKSVVCTNCTLSGDTVSLRLRDAAPPVNVEQTANVTFTVLYVKN